MTHRKAGQTIFIKRIICEIDHVSHLNFMINEIIFILKFLDVPRSLLILWCLFVLQEYILMLVTSTNETFDCDVTKTRLSISG